MFRYCGVAALVACASAETLKVGALFENGHALNPRGKTALDLWAQTINGDSSLNWDVTVTYGDATAEGAAAMTTAGAGMVDVLFCPYTTTASKTCIDNVAANFSGPIMVWGGATDSIFSTAEGTGNCEQRTPNNCYGFLPKASTYMSTGLNAMATAPMTVALIENNNGFSRGVCDGANMTVDAHDHLSHSMTAMLDAASSATSFSEADMAKIDGVIAAKPDIVVICGHNGNVEPAVVQIGKSDFTPKAIIATNSITAASDANYGEDIGYQNCIMMPQPWAESDASADPVVKWTSSAFKDAIASMNTSATYHTAAAGAACIAISNAMDALKANPDTRIQNLNEAMKALDVPSFYGHINFGTDGSWNSPMYTQQKQGMMSPIVAPAGDAAVSGTPNTELGMCSGWSDMMTCAEVKTMYKDQNCCGNPTASFSFGKDMRRLGQLEDEALLDRVRSAMEKAKLQGGEQPKILARQLQEAMEM